MNLKRRRLVYKKNKEKAETLRLIGIKKKL